MSLTTEHFVFGPHSKLACYLQWPPTNAFIIMAGSELSIFLDALSLHEKELILLAVNDNVLTTSAGGSHW